MRTCGHDGCTTRLSRYNGDEYCWPHRHDADVLPPGPARRPPLPIQLARLGRPESLDGVDPVDFVGTIASVFGYSYDELTAPGRRMPLVTLRAVLARDLRYRGFSLPAIGRLLGRDHSTVVNMLRMAVA